ncbi:MAG: hypothetical protein ACFFD4_29740, partial [Candidatus Odinarchaeota archaeon]
AFTTSKQTDHQIKELSLKTEYYGEEFFQSSAFRAVIRSNENPFSFTVNLENNVTLAGENVQLGEQAFDDQLFIRATDPSRVSSYLTADDHALARLLSHFSTLKEYRLVASGNFIDVDIKFRDPSPVNIRKLFEMVHFSTRNVGKLHSKRNGARRLLKRIIPKEETIQWQFINEKDTCWSCGNRLAMMNLFCESCGEKRIICSICRRNVDHKDRIGACPACDNNFHYEHLKEAVKVTGICPMCKGRIRTDEVIELGLTADGD